MGNKCSSLDNNAPKMIIVRMFEIIPFDLMNVHGTKSSHSIGNDAAKKGKRRKQGNGTLIGS